MLYSRAGALYTLLITGMTTVFATPGQLRENIEYGQAGGVSLLLDASVPKAPGPHPGIIIVHGGGWVRGDRRVDVQPLFRPLEDAGFAWFSISYRLAKDATQIGAGVQDVKQAVRYVREHAAEFDVDPDRIALVGESAGAQLASMAALSSDCSVRAVVAFYSPSDLVSLAKESRYVPESIRRQISGTPWEALVLAGLQQLSPINHVRAGMPPFLLIHGTSDSLVPFDQSERMCSAIRGTGGECELYPVKGGGHGVRWWESDHLTSYKQVMVRWLEKELATSVARA
jgi:alpha-L-fucosidase 2